MVFFLIGPIDRRRPVVCVVRATPLSRSLWAIASPKLTAYDLAEIEAMMVEFGCINLEFLGEGAHRLNTLRDKDRSWPSLANSRARLAPMPLEAPVTRATGPITALHGKNPVRSNRA